MKAYGLFRILGKYLKYYFTSKTKHGVHSPFVYTFITNCLSKDLQTDNSDIEELRQAAKRNTNKLTFKDFGQEGKSIQRSVAQIARRSLKPRKYAELIAKIAAYFKTDNAIELGTSLGITSAYIARQISGTLHSFEGAHPIAEQAKVHWEQLGIENIVLHSGSFDEQIPTADLPLCDLIFIDGHHQYAPTLAYFNQLLTHCSKESVFVFDDIHWSKDMERAWEEIKAHEAVTTTVDLFFIGLVFLRPELSKEHFSLRY